MDSALANIQVPEMPDGQGIIGDGLIYVYIYINIYIYIHIYIDIVGCGLV